MLPYRTAKEKMPSDNSAVPQPDAFDQKVLNGNALAHLGAKPISLRCASKEKPDRASKTRPTGHRARVVRAALDLVPWVPVPFHRSGPDPAKHFNALVEKTMLKERAPECVLETVHRLLRIGNGNRRRGDILGPGADDRAGLVVDAEHATGICDVFEMLFEVVPVDGVQRRPNVRRIQDIPEAVKVGVPLPEDLIDEAAVTGLILDLPMLVAPIQVDRCPRPRCGVTPSPWRMDPTPLGRRGRSTAYNILR